MALDELYGQAGLSDTAAPDHDELVLAKELRGRWPLAIRTMGDGGRGGSEGRRQAYLGRHADVLYLSDSGGVLGQR